MSDAILREGETCWCAPNAQRAAVLVDAEAYFSSLADAIERAERSVVLLGWDFHSRTRLRRSGADLEADADSELLALLERCVRRKRRLRVRILAWDFSTLYALEREWMPHYRFQLSSHRRIDFHFDDRHPNGGSQHQKIAVIDDALAFSGGLDLTACRWDSREHRTGDPLRNDPGFPDFTPFHDAQMAVDGDAALALGKLARERWQIATGRTLRRVRSRSDPWPPGLVPDFRNVDVGIARTLPAFEGRPEVREVEKLFLESIRRAKHTIYFENQYLSAHGLIEALAERLGEERGPEVVIVLPAKLAGWLEESTIGVLAARAAERLRAADRFGHLRLLQPELPGGGGLTIHAKLSVIDDRLLRVGSANLSNRSMGLDSECDLAIESTPERDLSREILRIRDELLAEQLDVEPEAVARAVEECGSLIGAIDQLSNRPRRLVEAKLEAPEWADRLVSDAPLFDPERPLTLDRLWESFASTREIPKSGGRSSSDALRIGLGVAGVLALLAAWQWTPLAEWLHPDALTAQGRQLEAHPFGAPLAALLFAVAATAFVPLTALTASCGALFGFPEGAFVALAGSVAAAGAGHALGRSLWRDSIRRISGPRLEAIQRRFAERGVLAVAVIRNLPLAPFGVVNLVAGGSRVSARDFLLGTLIGLLPGTLALVFFGDRLLEALREPTPARLAWTVLALLLVAGTALGAERLLGGRSEKQD